MAQQLYIGILLVGAVQGVVLGIMLFFAPSPRLRANRFLATLLFFLSYRIVAELLGTLGLTGVDSSLYYVFLEYNWVFGCLLFFYTAAYLNEGFRLKRRDLLHFLPVLVEVVFSIFIKTQNLFWDGSRESLSFAGYWGYVLWIQTPLQTIVFCGLIIVYSWISNRRLTLEADEMESAQGKQTTWLRRILLLYIAYAVLAIGVSVIDYLFFDYAFHPRYLYATYGGLAILTYWVALQGFAHRLDPALHRPRPTDVSVSREYEATLRALEAAMTETALYRDGNLSLSSLSQVVGVKPYVVTHILNNILNVSFSDYVNGHRVADVTRRLADPEYANYTLLAIANDAGFNSKASFNRVVKKLTGRSPSQLRTDIVSQARRSDGSTTQLNK